MQTTVCLWLLAWLVINALHDHLRNRLLFDTSAPVTTCSTQRTHILAVHGEEESADFEIRYTVPSSFIFFLDKYFPRFFKKHLRVGGDNNQKDLDRFQAVISSVIKSFRRGLVDVDHFLIVKFMIQPMWPSLLCRFILIYVSWKTDVVYVATR